MPTYEYRCTDCGHTFDIVQAFTDETLTECPECGGHLKKLFGNVGISFRGSGFYVNDSGSAKKSSSASGGSDSSTTKTSADSTTSTKDTTSASKPESAKAAATTD
ncbi:MAG: FmdB family transcriptional regulator [Actinobacteria bacterium]|nr:FmdB family transcriptional regulator [Actinomycetota bacterium]